MDSLPSQPATTYAVAPNDLYARSPREVELCERASDPDWIYLGAAVLGNVAGVFVNSDTKYGSSEAVRQIGPAFVGLAWGWTLGGGYLALPKCSPHYLPTAPREGDVRASWPLALSLALTAGAMAPILMGVETGVLPIEWSTEERARRVVIAGVAGFGGALLPYLLPPRTWRAARELENMRLTSSSGGWVVSYGVRF